MLDKKFILEHLNKDTSIFQWRLAFTVPYIRRAYIKNIQNHSFPSVKLSYPTLASPIGSLSEALDSLFMWTGTPEGEDFWDILHDKATRIEDIKDVIW